MVRSMIKIIDKQLLDDVSRLAQKSVRLRMNQQIRGRFLDPFLNNG